MKEPDRDQAGPLTPSSLINDERRRDRAGVIAPHKRLIGAIGACALLLLGIFTYDAYNNRGCTVVFTSPSVNVTIEGNGSVGVCNRLVDTAPTSTGAHVLAFWDQPTGSLVCRVSPPGSSVVVRRDLKDADSATLAGDLCAAANNF